jgi:hypothetical protein
VLRLNAAGALLWHRAVAGDVWGDLGAIAQTHDGQLAVVGRVAEPGFPSNDLWCAKLAAADGSALWQQAYQGELGDFGSVVVPLTGAGFLVGGTWGWGFEGESLWLERTDNAGGLAGCDVDRTTAFALIRPAVTALNGMALRSPGTAMLQSVGAQSAASAAVVTELCR